MKIALITLSLLLGLAGHAEENNSNQQPANSSVSAAPAPASDSASAPASHEEQRPCGLAPGEPITNCPPIKTGEDTEGGTSISVGGNTRPENPKVNLTSVGQTAQKVAQPIVTSKEEETGSSKKSDTGK